MIILAVGALSYTAYTNSRDLEREARSAYIELSERVENVKNENKRIKDQTQRIKQNPVAAASAAQNQTRMIRRNEVVVSPR